MLVVVDVETTGVDPKTTSIVSIGAVILEDQTQRFYGECKPFEGAVINQEALNVNGETTETLYKSDRMTDIQLIQDFIQWWNEIKQPKIVAGHNTAFDIGFLNETAKRAGTIGTWGKRSVDQHTLALAKMLETGHEIPVKNGVYTLDSDIIMKYVGIPAEPKPHNALNGALWEAEAIARLMRGQGVIPELKSHKVPHYLQK